MSSSEVWLNYMKELERRADVQPEDIKAKPVKQRKVVWSQNMARVPRPAAILRGARPSRRRVDAVRRQDVPLRPSALPCMCPFLIGSRTCRP